MDREEIERLLKEYYETEEERWSRQMAAWYRPHGAPGRLSEELLDRWHEENNTGAVHPSDVAAHSVKVVYQDGKVETRKRFTCLKTAMDYRNRLLESGICAVYVSPEGEEE